MQEHTGTTIIIPISIFVLGWCLNFAHKDFSTVLSGIRNFVDNTN